MVILVFLILASIFFGIFAFLLLTASDEVIVSIMTCMYEQSVESINKAQIEAELLAERIKKRGDNVEKKDINRAKELKEILKTEKTKIERLKKKKISLLEMVPAAGYKFIRLMKWDSNYPLIKNLYQKCYLYKEKKEAIHYTIYLVASLISSIILGICLFFLVSALLLVVGMGMPGVMIGLASMIVVIVLGYIPYDNVQTVINDRKEQIERQFPNIASKIALLVVAGMESAKAWELACKSGTGTLYIEMKRVIVDYIDNNVPPSVAFGNFIRRCDYGYTTKLATAILQDIEKGNPKIVELLTQLNSEAWLERKHGARRMGEKISSKLTVPTMLLFLGIIVMIILPVLSGFGFM